MKALLAFAIGLVMLVSTTIVAGQNNFPVTPESENTPHYGCMSIDLNDLEVPMFNIEDASMSGPDWSDPFWALDEISGVGIPEMVIDKDSIFSDIIDLPKPESLPWPWFRMIMVSEEDVPHVCDTSTGYGCNEPSTIDSTELKFTG